MTACSFWQVTAFHVPLSRVYAYRLQISLKARTVCKYIALILASRKLGDVGLSVGHLISFGVRCAS